MTLGIITYTYFVNVHRECIHIVNAYVLSAVALTPTLHPQPPLPSGSAVPTALLSGFPACYDTRALPRPVFSYPVMPPLGLPGPVVACLMLSCIDLCSVGLMCSVWPCLALTGLLLCCVVLPCHVLPYLVLSCFLLPCFASSCLVLVRLVVSSSVCLCTV